MVFSFINSKNEAWFLHASEVILKSSGKKQRIYFFKRQIGNGALDALPQGFTVVESKRSGLPVLKRHI